MRRVLLTFGVGVLAALGAITACGSDPPSASSPESIVGQTITLVTHDSFRVSPGTLEAFTTETGVAVVVQSAGDTGQMVAMSIPTVGNPLGDVMYAVTRQGMNSYLFADATAGLS